MASPSCVVRALEVGLLQRPGVLFQEFHAAEEGVEAGRGAQLTLAISSSTLAILRWMRFRRRRRARR